MEEVNPEILKVYFPNCRYLKNFDMNFPSIKGRFGIEESCYIKNTGHFNAVEAIISYNQLAYAFFAQALEKKLVSQVDWMSENEFLKEHQLPNSYIVSMNMRIKRPIKSDCYFGQIELLNSRIVRESTFFQTSYEFSDDNKGYANGKTLLAFSNNT